MSVIKVAVLGYGHLGKWHCDKTEACAESELYAIVEPFEKNATSAKQKHPQAKVVSSIEEVIDDIDAAVIVTPTSTHYQLSKYLIENKKNVFCEKPLCSTTAEAEEIVNLANDNEVLLQVGHSERFHLVWDKAKNYLKNCGQHPFIKINRLAAFKGRATDVDVVQDLMIHDLDLISFLTDSAVSVSINSFTALF
jgi:predicted dehydrogenase